MASGETKEQQVESTISQTVLDVLDAGGRFELFKSGLGTFGVRAFTDADDHGRFCITDHFTIENALNAAADKLCGLGKYERQNAWPTADTATGS